MKDEHRDAFNRGKGRNSKLELLVLSKQGEKQKSSPQRAGRMLIFEALIILEIAGD